MHQVLNILQNDKAPTLSRCLAYYLHSASNYCYFGYASIDPMLSFIREFKSKFSFTITAPASLSKKLVLHNCDIVLFDAFKFLYSISVILTDNLRERVRGLFIVGCCWCCCWWWCVFKDVR